MRLDSAIRSRCALTSVRCATGAQCATAPLPRPAPSATGHERDRDAPPLAHAPGAALPLGCGEQEFERGFERWSSANGKRKSVGNAGTVKAWHRVCTTLEVQVEDGEFW